MGQLDAQARAGAQAQASGPHAGCKGQGQALDSSRKPKAPHVHPEAQGLQRQALKRIVSASTW